MHHIFRLSTNRDYSDSSEPGDRTLAAFLGIGFYSFSTYDLVKKDASLNAKLPYGSNFCGGIFILFR